MTVRSFASTIAANGSWIGFAMFFLIAAALLAAAALVEIGQALFGLADLHCAACVASNDMGTGPATAGTVGAGFGSVGSGGLGGGSTQAPSDQPTPSNTDDRGDTRDARDTNRIELPRASDSPPVDDRIQKAIRKWQENVSAKA